MSISFVSMTAVRALGEAEINIVSATGIEPVCHVADTKVWSVREDCSREAS